MKKFISILLCIVLAFSLFSCASSDTPSEMVSSVENINSVEPDSSVEEVSSVEQTSSEPVENVGEELNISVEMLGENVIDIMTKNDYGWSVRGLPLYLCDWVNDNQLLFYTIYSESDGASIVNVRIFLYSIREQTAELIGETQGATLIKTFKANDEFYLLQQNHTDENNLFRIDLESKSVEKSVVGKISGEISKNGRILYDSDTSVKVCDFLSGEVEIEFEKAAGYKFLYWSPDDKYMAFMNDNKYKIYNLSGEVVFEIQDAYGFNWCQTPDFCYYEGSSIHNLNIVDLINKEVIQIRATSSALVVEPEFSVYISPESKVPHQYVILNHKTGKELHFRLDYKEKNDGTHFTLTNYNPYLKAFALTSYSTFSHEMACIVKLSNYEDEPPITVVREVNSTTKNKDGYVKKDFGRFYMWLPKKPSDFNKVDSKYHWWLDDNYKIENGNIYFHNGDELQLVAELVEIKHLPNQKDPFSKYDEQYLKMSSGDEALKFDEFVGKRYSLYERTFGALDWTYHTDVYCIKTEKNMIVMNFYPLYPGMSSQLREFEEILNSIEMK